MLLAWPLLPLASLASTSSVDEHAVVLEIRMSSAAQVQELKHAPGVDWWVELGNELVLVGAEQPTLSASAQVLDIAEDLYADELALRAVGCAAHRDAPGELLVSGPRWQLRRIARGAELPKAADDDEAWRRPAHDEVIARRYALDAPDAAPADPLVLSIVQRIDTGRWFADVSQLASWDRSSYGTTSLFAARDWIAGQFDALGLTVSKPDFTMPNTGGGSITRQNVIGTWTGTTYPNEWIVVGAHYDSRNTQLSSTVNAPGAEDNASGCAGVIELARALLPSRPQRSILFMCYAGEEQGLYGSTRHVQALQGSGDIAKVAAVVVMDMIGYSADSRLDAQFESYSTWQSYMARFGAAAATYAPELNVVISTNPFGSDHMPYLQASRQTVLAIEYDNEVYPHYHRSTDTPANIGPQAQAMGGAILKTNAAVLADLAGVSDGIFADGME